MSQNHPDQKYLHLAQKWVEGSITPEELEEYTAWLNNIDPAQTVSVSGKTASDREQHKEKIFHNIRKQIAGRPGGTPLRGWKAAAILVGISLAGFLGYLKVQTGTPVQHQPQPVAAVPDIQPGINGAVLTLANGKVIVLDTAANGSIDNSILKNNDAIVFEPAAFTEATQYNTLSTPRARQQQLVLPDGSRIWLNAESTIRFPTAFRDDTRQVDITGEAYLEVAPDKSKPFVVNLHQSSIRVLGTQFNVKAYPNETHIETTLLEGSVSFRSGNKAMLLKPGQQSRLLQLPGNVSSSDPVLTLQKAPDLESIMAWKNGFQSFKNADIETMFRQITRWYDVEVEYKNDIPPDITFTGEIPREVTLNQLIGALESKQIRFHPDAPKRKLFVQFEPDTKP